VLLAIVIDVLQYTLPLLMEMSVKQCCFEDLIDSNLTVRESK